MSFGSMPIANSFIKKNNFKKQFFYKMEAGFCKNCTTFQLIKVPKAKMMFNENYAYLASTSKFIPLISKEALLISTSASINTFPISYNYIHG